ncbi:MAG: type II toxin-antitoxin system Phd/YefM family antitoxin [Armatimonadota bacterium]
MVLMPIAEVRQSLSDVLNRVVYQGERVILTRHGDPIAAIVPLRSLLLIEKLIKLLDEDKVLAALQQESDATDLTQEELLRALGIEGKE